MVLAGGQLKVGGDASDVAADVDAATSGNGSSKTFYILLHCWSCFFLVICLHLFSF